MQKGTLLAVILCCLIVLLLIFGARSNQKAVSSKTPIPLPTAVTAKKVIPEFEHIFLIIMENKPYPVIIGSSQAPYLNGLVKDYALADNYQAITNPSLPNYLALIGGSTFWITNDCISCFVHEKNLVDLFEQNNKTWKAYMESMPSPCFVGNASSYAQKHDPFIYFDDIRTDPNRCKKIVPFDKFLTDLKSVATTPNFVWITPNLCNDMHDCSVKQGDTWLSQQIPLILSSSAFTLQNSLLIITFDEGYVSDNRIPTILIGPKIKKGFVSQNSYTHYALLHTIEQSWGLPSLTQNDAQSTVLSDFFTEK